MAEGDILPVTFGEAECVAVVKVRGGVISAWAELANINSSSGEKVLLAGIPFAVWMLFEAFVQPEGGKMEACVRCCG